MTEPRKRLKHAETTAEQRIQAFRERVRDWRARGSPADEIDFSDAPKTTAADWADAERTSFTFTTPPDSWGPGPATPVDAFIAKWAGREGGQERANYALFLTELTQALGLRVPDPADATTERNDYVFERAVKKADGSNGRIDLYYRDRFILEAKQSRWKGQDKEIAGQAELFTAEADAARGRSRKYDVLMQNALNQAHDYAHALPDGHDYPPFILICDVGRAIDVYADFSGQGRRYRPFPDPRGNRIELADLRRPEVTDRLRAIWTAPRSLDPATERARVTREIADRLAKVSRALEKDHAPEEVALFLVRCLFTMFAEDVKLLPEDSFKGLLEECQAHPGSFAPVVQQLWEAMDRGEFAHGLKAVVPRFNGEFFKAPRALPLAREEIGELIAAARADWKAVEPAIFGTLLEQALSPAERARLGAHYTPRPYVERLVTVTVMEPLRADWGAVLGAAERAEREGDSETARREITDFHKRLTEVRVLDPACGTGNFLYVALELMKELESEVLDAAAGLGGQESLAGLSVRRVDPRQFLGLEANARAVAIAEAVLWIGYLQANYRRGDYAARSPVLEAFGNIKHQDAVLAWTGAPKRVFKDGQEVFPNARRAA